MRRNEVILRAMQHTFSFLVLVLASCAIVPAADGGAQDKSRDSGASANPIRGEDHYVIRDGLRIYLWEKHKAGLEGTFANSGKVALLVHGGTWSGRPLFDLQIRDYSLMDFLAENGYDVWAIDLHGYGRSDKTDKDWTDSHSAAADIAAAVGYITRLRGRDPRSTCSAAPRVLRELACSRWRTRTKLRSWFFTRRGGRETQS